MEYSGLGLLSVIENDLVLRDEDGRGNDHWPPLPHSSVSAPHDRLFPPHSTPGCASKAAFSYKRPMEDVLNSSGESPSPVSKVSRKKDSPVLQCEPPRDAALPPPPEAVLTALSSSLYASG